MIIRRQKIALVGAGQIGGTLALLAGLRQLGDMVLYDVVEGMPQGKALDLCHLSPVFGVDYTVTGTNNLADIASADLVIVTSGVPRKPGMSRDDLLRTNAEIVTNVAHGIRKYAPHSFVIVLTNPLDAMVYLMQKMTEFPPNRVVGVAGVLDTARYEYFVAEELGVSVTSVSAMVLGGHGDDMVPVRSYTTVNGIPVGKLIPAEKLDDIEERVRNAGGEIVSLLKTGSAFYSPAAAAIQMAESYLYDQNRLLTAAAYCNGEYGITGIYVGVPVIIGAGGVEKIVEIDLSEHENGLLQASAERVHGLVKELKLPPRGATES